MSNDQTQNCCYSDDLEWWEFQDHGRYELLDYNQIAPPPDHAGRGHYARLLTSTAAPPRYPETANIQYPMISSNTSTTSVSPDNLMKRPIQVLTSPAKPKRRRGRGGTMATTTFLNSTITNFRELVQQHTGFISSTTPPPPSSSYYATCDGKGPITLCFANSSSTSSESALGFNQRNQ